MSQGIPALVQYTMFVNRPLEAAPPTLDFPPERFKKQRQLYEQWVNRTVDHVKRGPYSRPWPSTSEVHPHTVLVVAMCLGREEEAFLVYPGGANLPVTQYW